MKFFKNNCGQAAINKSTKLINFANLGLFAISILISLLLGEVVLRVWYKDTFSIIHDERSLSYRYDSKLGWFPKENSKIQLNGYHSYNVKHNSRGFRDGEHVFNNKKRIIFLGDSFVWGYDVEEEERFTNKFQNNHPELSVYNFGVSGYGTDQEYLLLQMNYALYKPDIVFLVFTANDEDDNSGNNMYGVYYKPYFRLNNNLELHGTPVTKSFNQFFSEHTTLYKSHVVRLLVSTWFWLFSEPMFGQITFDDVPVQADYNQGIVTKLIHRSNSARVTINPTYGIVADMKNYLYERHCRLIIGLETRNPKFEQFLASENIPFVDLSTIMRFDHYGEHWTPDGHTDVCNKIKKFLMTEGYLTDKGPL